MRPSEALTRHRGDLLAVLARYPEAMNPRIFGSVACGEDHDGSDLDLLVDMPRHTPLFVIGQLENDLRHIFPCPLDLVVSNQMHPLKLEYALRHARPL